MPESAALNSNSFTFTADRAHFCCNHLFSPILFAIRDDNHMTRSFEVIAVKSGTELLRGMTKAHTIDPNIELNQSNDFKIVDVWGTSGPFLGDY